MLLFCEGKFTLLCWAVPHVRKVLVMGPVKWLLLEKEKEKRKENYETTPHYSK
jgi:peptide subunit release factor 1 (eRF1)